MTLFNFQMSKLFIIMVFIFWLKSVGWQNYNVSVCSYFHLMFYSKVHYNLDFQFWL